MKENPAKKDTARAHEVPDNALSLPPSRTVLKRKSEEHFFCQRDLMKKTRVEETRVEKTRTVEDQNIIEPDSDCESNYKNLEAKSQALLNGDQYRKRTIRPRVQKKAPRTWCCQCEALQEFINLRCHCNHVTSDCELCEHFDYQVT